MTPASSLMRSRSGVWEQSERLSLTESRHDLHPKTVSCRCFE